MTSLASREMTEQEMINTCTAPQMAHLIQVLRQTIRNKDKEIEKWVDMVKQLQRDGELDPPEPKPLLADAQVGDLCQTRGEGYHLISDVYTDQRKYAYERNCGDTIYVRENGMFNLINHKHPFDIIHTEPLAEVGTAEWAWQMLMLQKPVYHPAEGEFQDTYYTKEGFVRCMAKTGWQLYEEKPEPEYKVGDWVEFNPGNNPKQVEIVEIDGDKLYYNTMYAGKTIKTHIYASAITRKLDPSEVVIHIGCLSGKVSQCGDKEEGMFALHTKKNAAVIPVAMLDPDTATLVRELLAAQEENNG